MLEHEGQLVNVKWAGVVYSYANPYNIQQKITEVRVKNTFDYHKELVDELIELVTNIYDNWFYPDREEEAKAEILITKLNNLAYEKGLTNGLLGLLNYGDGGIDDKVDPFCLNNYSNDAINLIRYLESDLENNIVT
jgi:hypothetical protein